LAEDSTSRSLQHWTARGAILLARRIDQRIRLLLEASREEVDLIGIDQ